MTKELCDVIESYGYVSFTFLDVSSKERMINLLRAADTANGFSIAEAEDVKGIVYEA